MTTKLETIYTSSLEQIKEYDQTTGFDKKDIQEILDRACTNGETEIAKFAVEKGANVSPPGGNPLRLASYYNNIDIVKHLLEKGANPQPDGNVALQYAAGQGNLEIVDMLIKAGADHFHGQPFIWAVEKNRLEVVKYFVKNTDVDIQQDDSRALKIAQKNDCKEVAEYLEGVEFYLNTIVGEERDRRATRDRLIVRDLSRLRKAATENDVELAKQLLKDRADIRMDDDLALRVAAERGSNEVMKLFLEHGEADVHALTDAAICGAAKNGHLECVKTLVKHGADIHALSNFPLLIAAHRGHTDIVKYFVEDLDIEVSRQAMKKMEQNGCFIALEIIRQHEKKKAEEVTAANLTYEKAEKLSDSQLQEVIWDWYKDVHGIRPRDLDRAAMLNFVKKELELQSNPTNQFETANQQPVNIQGTVNQSIERCIAEPGTREAFAFYGRETAKQISPELKIAVGDHTHRYIAYEDGKPVSGIVVALKNPTFGLQENTITTAYTDPAYREQGIAKALLKQVQKDFKNKLVVSPDLTEQGVKLFKPKQALTR
ncbi:GNAT family N-acetyltransferase [Ralstonia mannitolilytica]|uniref:GNAT family N-acetyltransferase n=1 Tax=Ralstonia mannitolilytica TaxID=105219 RepID=UPI001C96929E|nr:GNAT family N-acetyltransferase [Ralstonia mannitolilytica]MBY4717507.1 GNAT family N-acetyltransferase [Ralstonia mannitolilytica]